MSPHVQVWRWHVTMLTSILHRVSGVGLYAGFLIAAGWAVALAAGPDAYAGYQQLLGSPLGKLVLFLITLGLFFHLGSGVRHLIWDSGKGFELKAANAGSLLIIVFTLVATVGVWLAAYTMGAL